MRISPCETCGACCAFFRVSFPDTETNNVLGGVVPFDLTLPSNGPERVMKGSETQNTRCIALEGKVASRVKCSIYENRPSTCRKFNLSWENDRGNFLCDRARAFYGLQPFSQY